MAEPTLNEVKTAQFNVIGHVRLNCNITDIEGGIWDTDFVVDPARDVPIEPLGGLQGAVERWVAANPDQILPFDQENPPPRNDPVWENAPPPPDPIPPEPGTPPVLEAITVPDPNPILTQKVEDQTNDAGITEQVVVNAEPAPEEEGLPIT